MNRKKRALFKNIGIGSALAIGGSLYNPITSQAKTSDNGEFIPAENIRLKPVNGMNAREVQEAFGEVSESLTSLNVRYNPDTDNVEIFYNDKWNEWKFGGLQTNYLYKDGDEFELKTGGFVLYRNNTSSASFSKTGNVLTLDITNSPAGTSLEIGTDKPIDLTDISKVHFSMIGNNGVMCIIYSRKTLPSDGWETTWVKTASTAGTNDVVIDVSELSGSYYIGLGSGYSFTNHLNCSVDKIWLE